MPRCPRYCLHKKSGHARTRINGREIWLGKYNSAASLDKYQRLLNEWQATRDVSPVSPSDDLTVVELVAAYWEHAQAHYGNTGTRRSHANNLRPTLRAVRDMYGETVASEFGPLKLIALQEHWIGAGHSRTYVNDQTGVIRKMFKWGVSRELVPPAVWQALAAVANIQRGRSAAKENPPVEPVDDDDVDATLTELNQIVADMVRLQRLTGMRPGEVCQIRPCDVNRDDDVWTYRPPTHKSQRLGKDRIVSIGPRGQAVLMPYMLRPSDMPCFNPRETTSDPRVRDRYTNDSYRQAVQRAAKRAGVKNWSPNQLRHSRACKVRAKFGIEATRVSLGHSKPDMSEHYSKRDQTLSKKVARETG